MSRVYTITTLNHFVAQGTIVSDSRGVNPRVFQGDFEVIKTLTDEVPVMVAPLGAYLWLL